MHAGGLLLLASTAGLHVAVVVGVGLVVLLELAMIPVHVRDYRRSARRARAQREARARRKATGS